MPKYPEHLKELLKHYDKWFEDFRKTCRKRIIEGAKIYGADWKTKDNLKERDFEILDLINYTALDYAQKKEKQKVNYTIYKGTRIDQGGIPGCRCKNPNQHEAWKPPFCINCGKEIR